MPTPLTTKDGTSTAQGLPSASRTGFHSSPPSRPGAFLQELVRLGSFILLSSLAVPAFGDEISGAQSTTLVLAARDDPYLPLAQEIARAESLSVVYRLEDALSHDPSFLLWVTSPSALSDQAITSFSAAIQEYGSTVSVGIISASTIEKARALWQRGSLVKGEHAVAVNALYPAARIFSGRIQYFDGEKTSAHRLTKSALIEGLQHADYLTFTGHGASGCLRLDTDTVLVADDLPDLPPQVVGTASCQTFRIWNANSIALAFADHGAAGYAGFVYSPVEGYLLGAYDGLPFRYTWPGFSVGRVVQLQNRGTVQGFAQFAFYFWLGDPRLALNRTPPYALPDDRQDRGLRTISYRELPIGVVPLRIAGGAQYAFVEIPAVTSASDGDPFYNSRLHMANIEGDKYLLVDQQGGTLTLRLHRRPPWHWRFLNPLRNSLDYALVFLPQGGGSYIILLAGLIVWFKVGWSLRRRTVSPQSILPAIVAGFMLAALYGLYGWLRLPHITITSKPLIVSGWSMAATFLLIVAALIQYRNAKTRRGKVAGVLVAVFPVLMAALLYLAGIFVFNTFIAAPRLGAGIYNYIQGRMALAATVLELLLFVATCRVLGELDKWRQTKVGTSANDT